MNQLLSFLKLEPLKGVRTKLVVIVGGILKVLSDNNIITPDVFNQLLPYLTVVAILFGIGHFEEKK